MVKVLDCGFEVSEFELKSDYSIHFQTNALGKGMNTLILPCYRLNSITAILSFTRMALSLNNP